MADFSKSEKGESCYCLIHGEGIIISVIHGSSVYSVKAQFANGGCESYTIDGRINVLDKNPMLYHSKPEIIEAKRKVKKTFTKWVNVYKSWVSSWMYEDEKHALRNCNEDEGEYLGTIPVTIEIEVEE